MQIQPVQPMTVHLKTKAHEAKAYLLSLTDTVMEVICHDTLEKEMLINFISKFFKGHGKIVNIEFSKYCYKYTLEITSIQFQPGLLINTRL